MDLYRRLQELYLRKKEIFTGTARITVNWNVSSQLIYRDMYLNWNIYAQGNNFYNLS